MLLFFALPLRLLRHIIIYRHRGVIIVKWAKKKGGGGENGVGFNRRTRSNPVDVETETLSDALETQTHELDWFESIARRSSGNKRRRKRSWRKGK